MRGEPAAKERVLVIKPSSLGDIVHTLPAVSALKKAHAGWELQWLVNEEWAPLLDSNPDVDEVIRFPRKSFRGLGGLSKARDWAHRNLAPRNFDRALDFQGLLRSALLAKASGAGAVVGFSRARELAPFWYDEKISLPDWDRQHAVDRYLGLAATQGAGLPEAGARGFHLPEGAPCGIPMDRPLLALHPFSRGLGKSLTTREVVEFCQAVHATDPDRKVVLLGSDSWRAGGLPPNTVDLLGQTSLAQLIWVLRQADAVVSVDSGPMHLAAAITGRLISIHTWTDPARVGPWRKDAWFWRDGVLLKIGDIEAKQFPEKRNRRRLIEQLRQRSGRLLPEGSMARIAEAAGAEGVLGG
jgi:ADP-heptose:LPS heptosyltransferase